MSKNKRNNITTTMGMATPRNPLPIKEIVIAEFQPSNANSPKEVHLIITPSGIDANLFMRFKSPDTLGDLIEQLNFYRDRVFPGSDPINLDRDFYDEQN